MSTRRTGRPPGIRADGPEIRRRRLALFLTPTQLGARAGVGERTVCRAETGMPVSDLTVNRLAAALGVSIEDITSAAEEAA